MTPRLLYYLRRHTLRLIDFENTSCIIQDKVKTWEQRKFGDLADYKKGPFGSAITKNMFVPKSDDSVKVYEQQNAINKDWSLERYFLPKDYVLNKLKSFEVHGGDIIVSCAGTIGEIYEIPENAEDGVINQALMRVRVNKDIVDKKMFIISFINMIDDFTRAHSNGSAIKNIPPFADLKPMNVLIPSIEEQKRISGFFDNLDNLITLHQRKLNLICYIFKTWEQRKLGDFGKATGGTSIESEFSEDGKYKVISIGSYSEDSVYRDQGIRAIESEKTKNRILNEGDLTMILNDKTASGNIIGRVLLIEKSGVYVYNQRTERIEVDHERFDSLFIYEMLNAPNIREKIIKQSQGNTQIYVNWPTISETDYLVPRIEEQRCLGEFFYDLDNLITLHQRKCDELKEVKKYMLQNMFPGK